MNKPITMMELEEFMSQKTGLFDANSYDTYGLSFHMFCKGSRFDKAYGDVELMILICECGEIELDPSNIEEIYLNEDGIIIIEFNICLPNLEIKYRE